ncbi:MAG: PCRF domain-containing protein, partial [Verrucomicrobia bacterium]|nr:PCRF domain-containing protein [Verrucomicrobiota bacterium]
MEKKALFQKLDGVADQLRALEVALGDPTTSADPAKLARLSREHATLSRLARAYQAYKVTLKDVDEHRAILANRDEDPDLAELAEQELEGLEQRLGQLEQQIKLLLVPPRPEDSRNTIVEIRAGTGG